MDPDIDFGALMARFDTFLIGRKTFEAMRWMGNAAPPAPGIRNIVFSRTLRPEDRPNAMLRDDAEKVVAGLRKSEGRDIALFGGGELFRSLLAAGLVDEVSVTVIPVQLGEGVPLLPAPAGRARHARVPDAAGGATTAVRPSLHLPYELGDAAAPHHLLADVPAPGRHP
ncbi:MAG: dihydrofolate reductase family protein [Acidobacteriota bacterium]|nr:dihydrofolate reductase family protein [Acidobacteriota bacterium]